MAEQLAFPSANKRTSGGLEWEHVTCRKLARALTSKGHTEAAKLLMESAFELGMTEDAVEVVPTPAPQQPEPANSFDVGQVERLAALQRDAVAAFSQGDFVTAEKLFCALLETRPPGYEKMLINVATCQFQTGRFKESFQAIEEYESLVPNSLEGYITMVHNILTDRRRAPFEVQKFLFEKAKEWVAILVQKAPRNVHTLLNLGLLHLKAGNLKNAIVLFKDACATEPKNFALNHFLVDALMQDGVHSEVFGLCENLCRMIPCSKTFGQLAAAYARQDPAHPRGLEARAKSSELIVTEKNSEAVKRTFQIGWDKTLIREQSRDHKIVELNGVFVEGFVPIIYDNTRVFGFDRGHVPDLDKEFMGGAVETQPIDDPTLFYISTNPHNFYHWLLESSARYVAASSFVKQSNCKILFPISECSYVREITDLLGIAQEQCLPYHGQPGVRLHFRQLFVVDTTPTCAFGAPHLWDVYLPPPNLTRALRNVFQRAVDQQRTASAPCKGTVVYVQRLQPPRQVGNEAALIEAMQRVCGNKLVIHKGSGSVLDQAKLFREASVVVGPHGAGLSNVLFCNAGTVMIEFRMEPNVNPAYQYIAENCGFRYINPTHLTTHYHGTFMATEVAILEVVGLIRDALADNNAQLLERKIVSKLPSTLAQSDLHDANSLD
eukprot:c9219_g1_i1.p1 GENE.c9219_g1_i1~~c9219_g1_i1.p1  ORF type:complete len:664 (-),score=165.68 c9219_g1_i1:52-2043(-)